MRPMMHHISISRSEIENLDFEHVKRTLDRIKSAENSVLIQVDGYGEDQRELFEVSEVRRWFTESLDIIPWFYYLFSMEGVTNQYELLITCCSLAEVLDHKPLINPIMIQNVYGRCFECLNVFCVDNGLADEVNRRCTDRAFACLDAFLKKMTPEA